MNFDILLVFEKAQEALPLYEAAKSWILSNFDDVRIKVGKTQITFYNRHSFAYLWPARGRLKGAPKNTLAFGFGLAYRVDNPRIARAVEAYPNRWTQHVLIESAGDLDEELLGWVRESYAFADSKRGTAKWV